MLTNRYLVSVKNLPAILEQLRKGTAPDTFNADHLKSLGFTSSNDRGVIPLLKALGFLSDSGVPTPRYLAFRDESRSGAVLGEALLEAYSDIFHVNANPSEKDRKAIAGKFKATHNSSDLVAERQAATFLALLELADLNKAREGMGSTTPSVESLAPKEPSVAKEKVQEGAAYNLRYNIEVHLPATKDIEVYNAIFKSLRENLA
jgi:hypothetical protein